MLVVSGLVESLAEVLIHDPGDLPDVVGVEDHIPGQVLRGPVQLLLAVALPAQPDQRLNKGSRRFHNHGEGPYSEKTHLSVCWLAGRGGTGVLGSGVPQLPALECCRPGEKASRCPGPGGSASLDTASPASLSTLYACNMAILSLCHFTSQPCNYASLVLFCKHKASDERRLLLKAA